MDILSFAILGVLIFKEVWGRTIQFNWGIIYDSITKKPIESATIKIFEAISHTQKGQKITDRFGRYGFLVPPGTYYFTVEKQNYLFPTKNIMKKNDGPLSNVYHGEKITKDYPHSLLSYNIPIDPENGDSAKN